MKFDVISKASRYSTHDVLRDRKSNELLNHIPETPEKQIDNPEKQLTDGPMTNNIGRPSSEKSGSASKCKWHGSMPSSRRERSSSFSRWRTSPLDAVSLQIIRISVDTLPGSSTQKLQCVQYGVGHRFKLQLGPMQNGKYKI